MHPILFEIGDFPIYTYGLTMAMAFVIAFGWVFQEAKRLDQDLDDYYNICLICLIGGILGSRVLYVIVNWSSYITTDEEGGGKSIEFLKMFNLREGGLVWYGGVILVVFLIWGYTRWKDLGVYFVMDVFVAPLAVGLGVGRLGCLMSGCCYGCPTDLPWGMTYPAGTLLPMELMGKAVHPSPIYEMAAAFAIAGLLAYIQRKKTRNGQPLWTFFLVYGVARYVLEIFRGDELRGWVIEGVMSTSQLISIPLIFIAAFMLWTLRKPAEEE